MVKIEIRKFTTEISPEVMRTQATNVIRDSLDVIEELLTNSYDQWIRTDKKSNEKPLVVIKYEKKTRGNANLEILDFCGGMSSKLIETKFKIYGKVNRNKSLLERGQFCRGLKEALMASLDKKKTALIASKTQGEKDWAYRVKIRKSSLEWEENLHLSENITEKIHDLIPKEIDYFSALNNLDNYFYVNIPFEKQFYTYHTKKTFEKIQSDIRMCRLLDFLDVWFITEDFSRKMINLEAYYIKPKLEGFHKEIETIIDLAKYKSHFKLQENDLISNTKFQKIFTLPAKFTIFECDLSLGTKFIGFGKKILSRSKHPDIGVEGVVISDGRISFDKVNLFPRTDELKQLYMELEIPNFQEYSLAGTGSHFFSGPPLIPSDRTCLDLDHPIFKACLNNTLIQEAYGDALSYFEKKRRERRKLREKAVINEVSEKVRREINKFLKQLLTESIRKVDPSLKHSDKNNSSSVTDQDKKRNWGGGGLRKTNPILGITRFERRNGLVKTKPGAVNKELILCHSKIIKDNALIQLVVDDEFINDLLITNNDPDSMNESLSNPNEIQLIENRKGLSKTHYAFDKWILIGGSAEIGTALPLKIYLKDSHLTSNGLKLIKIIKQLNENGLSESEENWILENFDIDIGKEIDFFSNWDIEVYESEEYIVINYSYLITKRKSEESDENNEESGFFKDIEYVTEDEFEDIITGAKISLSSNSDIYNLTYSNEGYYLQIFVKNKYFSDCYDNEKDLHHQDESFYREIGNIVSLAVANVIISSPEQQLDSSVNISINIVQKTMKDLAPKLRSYFLGIFDLEEMKI